MAAPAYGSNPQLTAPSDDSAPLNSSEATCIQEVIGVLLYYARAVNSTMLVALASIASPAAHTAATAQAVTQLLNYFATHPDTVIRFHASDMVQHVHSDASYLSEAHAHSQAGGYFFLSA